MGQLLVRIDVSDVTPDDAEYLESALTDIGLECAADDDAEGKIRSMISTSEKHDQMVMAVRDLCALVGAKVLEIEEHTRNEA